jgi:hypothetical protein
MLNAAANDRVWHAADALRGVLKMKAVVAIAQLAAVFLALLALSACVSAYLNNGCPVANLACQLWRGF